MAGPFLGCDWGTTNLRAWVIDGDGKALRKAVFPFGVAKLAAGEAVRLFRHEVRPGLQAEDLPALLCGMIGSELGWMAVPHRDCPADATVLARALAEAEAGRAWIVPGVKCPGLAGAPDVMRGEETQLIGWIAADPAHASGVQLVCHPGTHAKWAVIENGRIMRFVTAMTGELFDLLRRHGVLKTEAPADDAAAFDEGVAAAGDGSALASRLFTTRTRVVGGGRPARSSASYLSGLLIGAEVASLPGLLNLPVARVALLGEPELCRWYARAMAHTGIVATLYDGEDAAVGGLAAIRAGA
jgi:2-dehydro-3-deoxygalactonokinase